MGPRIQVELRGDGETGGAHYEAELSRRPPGLPPARCVWWQGRQPIPAHQI